MVFWITFKQMKYFDYFRFIHPTINHTHEEELLFENIIPSFSILLFFDQFLSLFISLSYYFIDIFYSSFYIYVIVR